MRCSTAALALLLPIILASPISPSLPRDFTPDERGLLDINVDIGTCVKLRADVDLSANVLGLGADAIAKAGACICVDVEASLSLLSGQSLVKADADVDVYVQLAVGADARVVTGQSGKAIKALVDARAGLGLFCSIPPSLFPNSQHDFANGCCARKCNPGYTLGQNIWRQPVCTKNPNCPATQTYINGACGCNPATEIKCGNKCYDKAIHTCPSGVPKRRDEIVKRSRYECLAGKTYCPAIGHSGWECIDTMNDIESCGGCADPSIAFGPGVGRDCTAIAGTNSVSCQQGQCRVHSCQDGWAFAADGETCMPVLAAAEVEFNTTQKKLVFMRQS